MQKILLLEDDLNLNRGIALLLSREGYEVRQVYTIKEAKEAFQKGDYALVISDITLPDGTGLDFGRMVRAGGDTYLIYLTALDQEIDIVNGYVFLFLYFRRIFSFLASTCFFRSSISFG